MTDAPKDSPSPASVVRKEPLDPAWTDWPMDKLPTEAERLEQITSRWDHARHEDHECGEIACDDIAFLLALIQKHAPLASTLPPPEPSSEVAWFVERPHPEKAGMIQVLGPLSRGVAMAQAEAWGNGTAWSVPMVKPIDNRNPEEVAPESEARRGRSREWGRIYAAMEREVARLTRENEELRARIDVSVGQLEDGERDLTSAREALRNVALRYHTDGLWRGPSATHHGCFDECAELWCSQARSALAPAPVAPSEERTE